MSGALALAASIAAMDRTSLEGLAANRRVLSPGGVHEPLGLAIELLRPDSVTRALQGAHREQLAALVALSQGEMPEDRRTVESLAALGLVGLDTSTGREIAIPELAEFLPDLETSPNDSPRLGHTSDAHAATSRGTDADTSAWYGAALTSVRRAAHLLRAVAHRPVRLGRKGRPALTSVRELADAAHCEAELVDRLIDVLRAAGLLEPFRDHSGGEHLGTTPSGRDWLTLDYPNRWLALASASVSQFDARLRRGLDETSGRLSEVIGRLPADYPLLPAADLDALARVADTAEDLGLTVAGRLTPAASALLDGRSTEALGIAEEEIPAPAPGVYLQPDLSVIVPGPLRPEDEAALSAITEVEQLGPAASLRITPGSLARAVRGGFGPGEIGELLRRLSLTGIPQPLEYLLGDLERKLVAADSERADRHALVGGHGAAAGQTLRPREDRWHSPATDDPAVRGSYSASPSQYQASPARPAASPSLPAASSSRPAASPPRPAAEAHDSYPVSPSQTPAAPSRLAEARDELAEMVDRVLASSQGSGGEGDLTRRLKLAIRDRSPVQVTAVAGKDERVFTLLPMSIQGGRLRATDQTAGVERTLPVSAITAVEAA